MPPPTKAQIKPFIDALFVAKGFTGKNIYDLSDVIADSLAQSMTMFRMQVLVMPGIPTSPVATVGPGKLM